MRVGRHCCEARKARLQLHCVAKSLAKIPISICGKNTLSLVALWYRRQTAQAIVVSLRGSGNMNYKLNLQFIPFSLESDAARSMTFSSIRTSRPSSIDSAPLFVKISNMQRFEHMTDLRDSVVLGVGSTN